jgi:hypothetical protein
MECLEKFKDAHSNWIPMTNLDFIKKYIYPPKSLSLIPYLFPSSQATPDPLINTKPNPNLPPKCINLSKTRISQTNFFKTGQPKKRNTTNYRIVEAIMCRNRQSNLQGIGLIANSSNI